MTERDVLIFWAKWIGAVCLACAALNYCPAYFEAPPNIPHEAE